MFVNYLKTAIRNIMRQKGYSLINLAGLTIGMVCCILILLFVQDELSYDKYHEKADQIYRIVTSGELGGGTRNFAMSPYPAGPVFTNEIPEVIAYSRLVNMNLISGGDILVTYEEKRFEEAGIFVADTTFFEIFTYSFIAGDQETALDDPNSVVITEETAVRIFGDEEPIGKTVNIAAIGELKITGIIEEVPRNSHFTFNYIASTTSLNTAQRNVLSSQWFAINGYVYLLFDKNADPKVVEDKMADVFESNAGEQARRFGIKFIFNLQNITDIHLRSHLEVEIQPNNEIAYVYIFSAVAVFILLIACINFMNLSTARSANRAREVGLRKVFGAYRINLVGQFLSESVLMSVFGLILAISIVFLLLPGFNSISGKEFTFGSLFDGTVFTGLIGLIIFTGVFAGSYPAFFLSAFQPGKVLRGMLSKGSASSVFRKSLVVFQFSISIILIISTMIVLDQIDFMKNKDIGFDKEQILIVNIQNPGQTRSRVRTIKEELKQNPHILEATFSSSVPGRLPNTQLFLPEGREQSNTEAFDQFSCDHDFMKTYGIEILYGRDFSTEFSTDTLNAFLVNETAAVKLEWGSEAVGKGINFAGSPNAQGKIIGIFKDYHHRSLKQVMEPMLINIQPRAFGILSLKINTDYTAETVGFVRDKWAEFEPGREFDYYFLDENFDSQYRGEERLSEIFTYFAGLAILIACLGLFGLASFTAEQRTKEIGIKKVLGATVNSLVLNLSNEFIKWVLIANVFAWPATYYLMSTYWLSNFAFRLDISILTFIIAGSSSLIIALLTVSYQAVKAASANPVNSLKHE
ncbi:MAG: FtsX-like permease family protein [bacterium]|nr:FtsX-like permease family protein [bacterium]